jgi:[protein-PII] uridylyltransferase
MGDGLQVMVYVPDQPLLFARLCGFFARWASASSTPRSTPRATAMRWTASSSSRDDSMPYRDMIGLIEHDIAEQLKAGCRRCPPSPAGACRARSSTSR